MSKEADLLIRREEKHTSQEERPTAGLPPPSAQEGPGLLTPGPQICNLQGTAVESSSV